MRRRRSRRGEVPKWLIIVLVIVGVLGLICCAGAFIGGSMLGDKVGEEFQSQFSQDERLVEHLGEILEVEYNWSDQADRPGFSISHVRGEKASGVVHAVQGAGGVFTPHTLILDDGTRIELTPEHAGTGPDSTEPVEETIEDSAVDPDDPVKDALDEVLEDATGE